MTAPSRHWLLASYICALALGLPGCGTPSEPVLPLTQATRPGVASAPAGPATDLQTLIADLASAGFATREDAQRRLTAVPLDRHDELAALARATNDPEVQARVQLRLDDMEFQRVMQPPPISLHVKNATRDEVAGALGKALGIALSGEPNGLQHYSLDADGQSFWDVYHALSRHDPMRLLATNWSDDVFGRIGGRKDAVRFERHEGLTVFAATAPVLTFAMPGAPPLLPPLPANTRAVSLFVTCVLDPRIRLLQYRYPLIGSVVDSDGTVLLRQTTGDDDARPQVGQRAWRDATELYVATQDGPRSVSVTGEVRALIPFRSTTLEIPDIEKKTGQTFTVGTYSFTLKGLSIIPQAAGEWFDATIDLDAGKQPDGIPDEIVVADRNGRVLFDAIGNKGIHVHSVVSRVFAGPYKLIITTADKAREIRIPFELKDIPLPP
jgi:hypothetical protein